jgi:YVTN family beta-propeller protein
MKTGRSILLLGASVVAVACATVSVERAEPIDCEKVREWLRQGGCLAVVDLGPTLPEQVVVNGNAVWIRGSGTPFGNPDQLYRIDPQRKAVVAAIPIGRSTVVAGLHEDQGLVAGMGAVWVGNSRDGTVSRIDPQTNQVVATIPVTRSNGMPIGVGAGAVWVGHPGGSVTRIDPQTNQVVATIPSGQSFPLTSGGVAVGEGAVWVAAQPQLIRIDPQTSKVVGRVQVVDRFGGFIPGLVHDEKGEAAGALWALGATLKIFPLRRFSVTVFRIDPHTNQVAATIPVSQFPFGEEMGVGLAAGEGAVWIGDSLNGTVWRLDSQTNKAVPAIRGEVRFQRLFAVGHGAIWLLGLSRASFRQTTGTWVVALSPAG